jgi:hypothetical protein
MQVDSWLASRLIFGLDDLTDIILLAGVEAGALAGVAAHAIIHSTSTAPVN